MARLLALQGPVETAPPSVELDSRVEREDSPRTLGKSSKNGFVGLPLGLWEVLHFDRPFHGAAAAAGDRVQVSTFLLA